MTDTLKIVIHASRLQKMYATCATWITRPVCDTDNNTVKSNLHFVGFFSHSVAAAVFFGKINSLFIN